MREIDEVQRDLKTVWRRLMVLLGENASLFEVELLLVLRDLDADPTRRASAEVRALTLRYAAIDETVVSKTARLLDRTPTLRESPAKDSEGTEDGFEREQVPTSSSSPRHVAVPVWYATDRRRQPGEPPSRRYGIDRARSEADGSTLGYGLASVSIPDGHRKGRMESPKWYKLQFRENPDEHITILSVDELDRRAWFGSLEGAGELAGTTDTSVDVLVFVHGYKTSWADAIKRAAQFSYDIEFDGRTVAYTWPSQGKVLSYTVDENNAAWSAPHFTEFLRDLMTNSGARRVHIVAHSMGNRITTAALGDLGRHEKKSFPTALGKVVFAAPDVDADTFREIITAFHKGTVRLEEPARPHLTLYTCGVDAALDLSRRIHKLHRAGHSVDGVVISAPPMETVEVTQIVLEDNNDDRVGHAYFCSNRTVLGDMNRLVLKNELAGVPRFGLQPSQDGKYWTL